MGGRGIPKTSAASGKVGDRYIGHNRTAERAWSVPVMFTIADRGRCFAFVTRLDEGPYVRWAYVSFRQARLTSHVSSVTSDAYPQPRGSLWTARDARMMQGRNLLKDFLRVSLPPQGMALLTRVPASNGSDAALRPRPPQHASHVAAASGGQVFFFL